MNRNSFGTVPVGTLGGGEETVCIQLAIVKAINKTDIAYEKL